MVGSCVVCQAKSWNGHTVHEPGCPRDRPRLPPGAHPLAAEPRGCDHDATEHGGAGCEVFVRAAATVGERALRLCPCSANAVQARATCGPLVLA